MFKGHMSLLQIKLEEIPLTQFKGKLCSLLLVTDYSGFLFKVDFWRSNLSKYFF